MAPNIRNEIDSSISQISLSSNTKKSSSQRSLVDTKTTTYDTNSISVSLEVYDRFLPWIGIMVWPFMILLPLVLSNPLFENNVCHYSKLFSPSSYEYDFSSGDRPKPLGLILGVLCVAIGQFFSICFFYFHKHWFYSSRSKANEASSPPPIQAKGAPNYNYFDGVSSHASSPEGIIFLAMYLSMTWMLRLMPPSYYSLEGFIDFFKVFRCLAIQDGLQYIMHRLEHIAPTFYKYSHKPHHKFTNPKLFDAFDGSVADTFAMILIPLFCTAWLVPTCNVWTYMAFGSIYANWLTLIHSEYPFPWDKLFRTVGFGTPGDHHVHHKFFKYNFGHLFMWYDWIFGTYRDPMEFAPKVFTTHV